MAVQQIQDRIQAPRALQESRGFPLVLIWSSWLAIILVLALAHTFIAEPRILAQVLLLLHAAATMMVLLHSSSRPAAGIFGLSLVLRVAIVFWDLNFSHIFGLPHSGADSEFYYLWAVQVGQDPALLFEHIGGGVFSKLCGVVFWLIGPVRVVVQYTNVLLGLSCLIFVERILESLPLTPKRHILVLAVVALLPDALILSALFLRESLISFLVAVSVYYFIRWFNGGSLVNMVGTVLPIVAAATLHAGIICVAVGYAVVMLFYRPASGRFGWSAQSFVYLIAFGIVAYLVMYQYPDIFLGKFQSFDSEADLLKATNRRSGGSQYLTNLTVTSYFDLLRFGPLRAFYFLGSPMPWSLRGVMDLLTFAFDSLFYLGVPILVLIRLRRLERRERLLAIALLVVLAVATLIFGAGVSNSGTATRHRFKLISIVMVLFAIAETASAKVAGGVAKSRKSSSTPVPILVSSTWVKFP